jgi:hypothetical protein
MAKERDYAGKLYDTFSKQMDGFTKTEPEFRKALESPEYQKKVYSTLSTQMDGFSRKEDEFYSLLKKKENTIGPTASSGMGVLLAGKGKPQETVTDQTVAQIKKQPITNKEEDLRVWDRTKSTLSTLGKSIVDGVLATSSEQIAIVSKTLDDELREFAGMKPLNKPITEYQTYKLAQQIKSATTDTFAPNPEFKGELQETVAQTAGDLLGLVATAIITKNPQSALAKLGTGGIVKGLANATTRKVITRELAKETVKSLAKPTAFVAAAQTGTRNYDEALAKGATEDEANAMYWSTAATGAIANNLPIGSLLNRFDKASGGKMKDMVIGGVVGGIEEAVTEGIEQISTNFAAQNIYDETRKLFEGVGKSTAMGGGMGFVLNAMGVKLGSLRNQYKNNPEKLAEVDQSIEYIKDVAEVKGQSEAMKLSKEEQVSADRYTQIIEDPNQSEDAKDIAKTKLQELTGSKIIQSEAITKKVSKLSEDDQLEVKLINSEIDRLRDAVNNSSDVDIKDQLEADIEEQESVKQSILDKADMPTEIIKAEVEPEIEKSPAVLSEDLLDAPSVEEVPTETPLSAREKQMTIVPEEKTIETSPPGKFLSKVGDFFEPLLEKPLVKSAMKLFTTGDLNTIRAKEIVDAEAGATIDRMKSISTKIQNLVNKDKKSRDLANTVISVDGLDDKVSKLAASDNYTAISELTDNKYTPTEIKDAVEYYKGDAKEAVSAIDKEKFDEIVAAVSGIGSEAISTKRYENAEKVKSLVGKILNYDTIGNSAKNIKREAVTVEGTQSPMLTGAGLSTGNIGSESRVKNTDITTDQDVNLVDLRAQLVSLPNGENILKALDEAVLNRDNAIQELSSTDKGRKILEQAQEARGLIDSFAEYMGSTKAAQVMQKRIGDTIAQNKGSYLKRSFRFWKDKKYNPTEAMKNVALESVVNDMMIIELTKLNKSTEYNRLQGDAKRQYLSQITEDVKRKAKIELDTYLDEIREQRDGGALYMPNTKSEKVNGKTLAFRKLIDESFLDLLGNINDPISQFHDTVLAQTQIKTAANLHWIINEVTGKENMFDSREQVVEFNGTSEGFKQINDKNSVLNGKWVSEDIYDVLSSSVPTKEGTGFHVYRKVLSTMRKSKTIYNFFAGWTTNLIGGELTLAANGVIPNPKKTGKYLLNRAKYIKNPENLTKDVQDDIQAMKDNGFWSTSVSAGTIKLLDDNYMDMTAYDRGDEVPKTSTRRFIDKAKRLDDNIVRNYSVIDDFTKLVFFREKKDIFSQKLFGKKFDQLNKSEKDIVHANVAERGKENIATMSRLPRIYQKLAKYPLGDFLAFRISAIKSGANTFRNAIKDINTGYSDTTLSKVQRDAYLRDGLTTMSGMTMAAVANSILYGQLSSFMMGLLSDKDEEIFVKKKVDGVEIGSKADLYVDFKGTPAVNPQWMRGKNNIVSADDGKGNIELLNISNKDPYDELFGLFLPRAGTGYLETWGGIIKETASPNMTVNLFTNIIEGQDQWGRDIWSGDDNKFERTVKGATYLVTEALVPPAMKNLAKETYKEIQESKAVKGDTKKEIKKKDVGAKEYLNALVGNAPMLLNRTYKVNIADQLSFYAADFYKARPEKFNELDATEKQNRFKDLDRIVDGYNYVKRYSILNNNSDFLDKATKQMFKSARGISNEEKKYILYGTKSK